MSGILLKICCLTYFRLRVCVAPLHPLGADSSAIRSKISPKIPRERVYHEDNWSDVDVDYRVESKCPEQTARPESRRTLRNVARPDWSVLNNSDDDQLSQSEESKATQFEALATRKSPIVTGHGTAKNGAGAQRLMTRFDVKRALSFDKDKV